MVKAALFFKSESWQRAVSASAKASSVTGQPDTALVSTQMLQRHGFSKDEIHAIVAPRRTFERRIEKNQPLNQTEADRVFRLERVAAHAERVFGSAEKAHRWLRKPCRALGGLVPIELLASETGAYKIEAELHAIDHGMFA